MRKKHRNRIEWLERDVWELNNPPKYSVGTDVIHMGCYNGPQICRVISVHSKQQYVAGYTGKTFYEWVYGLNNYGFEITEWCDVKESLLTSVDKIKELLKDYDGKELV